MTRRLGRVNANLRQEISAILANEVKDPRVEGMVSVTAVDVSPDMRRARVYVSVYGAADDRPVIRALASAAGFVGRRLGDRLRSRSVPQLQFRLDRSIARGAEISDAIARVAADAPPPPEG